MRWSANFTPVLEELGCKIIYAVDREGRNKVKKTMNICCAMLTTCLNFENEL